jgi:muramoyltetrapeptide carboxypeptidase
MRRNTAELPDEKWIGIAATSTLVDRALLKKALPRFARWGYPVRVDDSVHGKFRYFAGTDEERAAALIRLLKDPVVATIWCARGGYGAARILSHLDQMGAPILLRKNPKLLVGYSDVTALHFYFQKSGCPTLHAPMPATPSWLKLPAKVDRLLPAILGGEIELGKKSYTASWKTKVMNGAGLPTEGVLRGGNLSLLTSLVGTRWQPDLNGSLLFLEDCAEAPYRVDRMLTQLENAGMLSGVRALLLGDFEADVVYREPKEKKYWKEIFLERFASRGIPVISGLPVGHGKLNEPLPLGVQAAIDARGRLLLLEQAVG